MQQRARDVTMSQSIETRVRRLTLCVVDVYYDLLLTTCIDIFHIAVPSPNCYLNVFKTSTVNS